MKNFLIVNCYLPPKVAISPMYNTPDEFIIKINEIDTKGTFLYTNYETYTNTLMYTGEVLPEASIRIPLTSVKITYNTSCVKSISADKIEIWRTDLFCDAVITAPYLDTLGISEYWLLDCTHNLKQMAKIIAKDMKK